MLSGISISDFNSHAHVERDINGLNRENFSKISTHTLTWSVTIAGVKLINALYDFNSHAHVERDLNFLTMKCIYLISTHTLTWSVTH